MKTLTEVSPEKLRGGFYTPDHLVRVCLNRVDSLIGSRTTLRVLEPAAGDGAFLRGLKEHALSEKVSNFFGVELIEEEARKCEFYGVNARFSTRVRHGSFLPWAATSFESFDVVVGNPPFVRYQFIPENDLNVIPELGAKLGIRMRGVSNLWIPILIGSLDRLDIGGAMAVVVPSEIFTGVSAAVAREWILSKFENLQIDMFEPGTFPDVLQQVVVISGIRCNQQSGLTGTPATATFVEHSSGGTTSSWKHTMPIAGDSWTKFLLTPTQLEAYEVARESPAFRRFSEVAKLEVSIVTGANDFFSVNKDEAQRFKLKPWAMPLLPRIRYAPGITFKHSDHDKLLTHGAKGWLVPFTQDQPDPLNYQGASSYLKLGESRGLHTRYKTSIRSPWYRVPSVRAGDILLSKRSHRFPRLIWNECGALTTDTIYRGRMLPSFEGRERDLVGAFHNSLTLLTAELEGRSFGGGVLELVPSEIARLLVPFPVDISESFEHLDQISRHSATENGLEDALVEETDRVLVNKIEGFTHDIAYACEDALQSLRTRRFLRN